MMLSTAQQNKLRFQGTVLRKPYIQAHIAKARSMKKGSSNPDELLERQTEQAVSFSDFNSMQFDKVEALRAGNSSGFRAGIAMGNTEVIPGTAFSDMDNMLHRMIAITVKLGESVSDANDARSKLQNQHEDTFQMLSRSEDFVMRFGSI